MLDIMKHLNQRKIINKLFYISSRSMSDHTLFVKWTPLKASLDNVISHRKKWKSLNLISYSQLFYVIKFTKSHVSYYYCSIIVINFNVINV